MEFLVIAINARRTVPTTVSLPELIPGVPGGGGSHFQFHFLLSFLPTFLPCSIPSYTSLSFFCFFHVCAYFLLLLRVSSSYFHLIHFLFLYTPSLPFATLSPYHLSLYSSLLSTNISISMSELVIYFYPEDSNFQRAECFLTFKTGI